MAQFYTDLGGTLLSAALIDGLLRAVFTAYHVGTAATDQGVRTVIGTWQDHAAGIFFLTIREGPASENGEPYARQCDGEIDRKAHERAVLQLAVTEWTTPGMGPATDITFRWRILPGSRWRT